MRASGYTRRFCCKDDALLRSWDRLSAEVPQVFGAGRGGARSMLCVCVCRTLCVTQRCQQTGAKVMSQDPGLPKDPVAAEATATQELSLHIRTCVKISCKCAHPLAGNTYKACVLKQGNVRRRPGGALRHMMSTHQLTHVNV